ncbi:hypothetical protein FBU30_003948 [Linnemannia zychae]|nr:hypothetical protein FBU30_003948 [Linnemannia zychae]
MQDPAKFSRREDVAYNSMLNTSAAEPPAAIASKLTNKGTGADDYVFVSVRPRVTSTPTPERRVLTNSGAISSRVPSIIYFAATRTVRHMHELCSSSSNEKGFQQQFARTPGIITPIVFDPSRHSEKLEWLHSLTPLNDAPSIHNQPQSHKGVFAFLTRNRTTGSLVILAMVSLWLDYISTSVVAPAIPGVQSPSTLVQQTSPTITATTATFASTFTSAWNVRHWRRSTTPEKTSNISRLPSFWNRLPALPLSHNSLPSLPETAAHLNNNIINRPPLPALPGSTKESDNFSVPTNLLETPASAIIPSDILLNHPSANTEGLPAIVQLANNTEDGPLFRATVAECENYIRTMKSTSKRILKAAQVVMETRKAWVAAEEAFVRELEAMRTSEPLVDNYWRPLSQHLIEYSEMLAQRTRDLLIQPFSQYYGVDIKTAELQRKSFEEESKEYYSFLSRYMGMKQDSPQRKVEADLKHERKRRHFELKRLEYWNFLMEMKADGRKGDELYISLSEFTGKHRQLLGDLGAVAEELWPGLETALESNKQRQPIPMLSYTKPEQNSAFIESESSTTTATTGALFPPPNIRHDSTRTIDSDLSSSVFSQNNVSCQQLPALIPLQPSVTLLSASSLLSLDTTKNISSPSNQDITGIRDLEHQDIDASLALGRRKEGFLFATNRPSPHNSAIVLEKPNNLTTWRKYWCVLSEGQMHEYSHWKRGITQPHNEPINLRIATVRSCRNQDRRFCFEVITPKFRRVYQATSTEDMNSWINVISNAIQSLLNGTSSCRNLNLQYIRGGMEQNSGGRRIGGGDYNRTMPAPDGKGLMAGLGGMARASMEQILQSTSLPISLQDKVQPGQAVGRKRGGSAANGLNEIGQIILPLAAQASYADSETRLDHHNNIDKENSGEERHLGSQLLQAMRDSDIANTLCAECGAKNPDWCVINLGIIVCIECSGIHRSLGTHISKVRSFTLDTNSYTKDLVEFIRSVGNAISNQIWEANLLADTLTRGHNQSIKITTTNQESTKVAFRKPTVNDTREYKVSFIRKKYVDRAFVERFPESEVSNVPGNVTSNTTATEALFDAVSANNIPGTIAAFAAGGTINTIQRADHASDSGPFIETQAFNNTTGPAERDESLILTTIATTTTTTTAPLPSPQRTNDDMFGLGPLPNISDSSHLNKNMLNKHEHIDSGADESAMPSNASSQLARSTPGATYPISSTERDNETLQASMSQDLHTATPNFKDTVLEIRPRPTATGGRCISSVMVMQTSPLLIALRNSVPFSFDPQYDVYPLAEFLMQNGAASDMSMEVKVVSTGTVDRQTKPLPPILTRKDTLSISDPPMARRQVASPSTVAKNTTFQAAGEIAPTVGQSIIERDVPLQPAASIDARLSADTTVVPSLGLICPTPTTASTNSGLLTEDRIATPFALGAAFELADVSTSSTTYGDSGNNAMTENERKALNRRSVGQIIELRGDDGATAMEYLRSKSAARGDIFIPSPCSSPTPGIPISSLESEHPVSPNTEVESTKRPQSLKERNSLFSTMSASLINTLALSPRLRPVLSSNATSPFISSDYSRGADNSHPPLSSSSGSNHPDISALFQKRRQSDGGLGSSFFSTMKGSSSKDKERTVAKAQARKSGDFSLFSPIVIVSPRQISNRNNNAHNRLSLNVDYSRGTNSSPNLDELSPSTIPAPATTGPSRTQKVKASLSKSIRLSASYFKNTNHKSSGHSTREDRDHPPPVVHRIPLLDNDQRFVAPISSRYPTMHQSTSAGSLSMATAAIMRGEEGMSGEEEGDESEPEDEFTVEELLARQEARHNTGMQSQQHQQPNQQQHANQFLFPRSRPSSTFLSSMPFSSTPNLAQQAQRAIPKVQAIRKTLVVTLALSLLGCINAASECNSNRWNIDHSDHHRSHHRQRQGHHFHYQNKTHKRNVECTGSGGKTDTCLLRPGVLPKIFGGTEDIEPLQRLFLELDTLVRYEFPKGAVDAFKKAFQDLSEAFQLQKEDIDRLQRELGVCKSSLSSGTECQKGLADCIDGYNRVRAEAQSRQSELEVCKAGSGQDVKKCQNDLAAALNDKNKYLDSLDNCNINLASKGAEAEMCANDRDSCVRRLERYQAKANVDLDQCNSSLKKCMDDNDTLKKANEASKSNLNTCKSDQSQCKKDLDDCNAKSCAECNDALTQCKTGSDQCTTDLADKAAEAEKCAKDLADKTIGAETCNTNLQQCQTDLAPKATEVDTCKADLATCATDRDAVIAKTKRMTKGHLASPDGKTCLVANDDKSLSAAACYPSSANQIVYSNVNGPIQLAETDEYLDATTMKFGPCDGSDNQNFVMVDGANPIMTDVLRIKNPATGNCLQVADSVTLVDCGPTPGVRYS